MTTAAAARAGDERRVPWCRQHCAAQLTGRLADCSCGQTEMEWRRLGVSDFSRHR